MDAETRVCPFCGEPPGAGVFCAACGRNLGEVERLPTRAQWETGAKPASGPVGHGTGPASGPVGHGAAPAATSSGGDGARGTTVEAFLAAMHAAGDPGAEKLPRAEPGFLGRTQHVRGWVLRDAGVFVTADGRLHRLDRRTQGINYRGPAYADIVGPEADRDVAADLAALLRAHGL